MKAVIAIALLVACDGTMGPGTRDDADAGAPDPSGDAGSPGEDAGTVDGDTGPAADDGGQPAESEDAGTVTDPPPPPPPPPAAREGIWISVEELRELPTEGPAWEHLVEAAERDPGRPDLSDQDQMNNVWILARALVHARTGQERYRTEVREACMEAIGTEAGGRTLALGRELAAYVIAADLVGLEPAEDERFRAFLRDVRARDLDGRTLISTHEDRPNNWGTHAGASRMAVAAYLGDDEDLARAAAVFRGWLGEREHYAGFRYSEPMSWHADESSPVGINAAGATIDGESVDGVIPDDMRRGCGFRFPPCETGYPWGALEGALVMAEILHRRGYDAWQWGERALLRAVTFLRDLGERFPGDGWWAEGDDEWQVWLVNHAYGTDFPAATSAREGKNMGWTDWTHDRATRPR